MCSRFSGMLWLFHPDTGAIYRVELELDLRLFLEILNGAPAAFPITIIINLNPPPRHYLTIQATKDLLRRFIPVSVHVQEGDRADPLLIRRQGLLKKAANRLDQGLDAQFAADFTQRFDWRGTGPGTPTGGLCVLTAMGILIGGRRHALERIEGKQLPRAPAVSGYYRGQQPRTPPRRHAALHEMARKILLADLSCQSEQREQPCFAYHRVGPYNPQQGLKFFVAAPGERVVGPQV